MLDYVFSRRGFRGRAERATVPLFSGTAKVEI